MARVSTAFSVLTVCVGNVCRSPLAERLLRARLPRDRFEVTSAGIRAMAGSAMSDHAATELVGYGGSADGFEARQLTPVMVAESDLVLAATREIRSAVLAESPAALRRTFTLLELAALLEAAPDGTPAELVEWAARQRSTANRVPQDVEDPYQRGAEAHASAAAAIHGAVDVIAARLAAGVDVPAGGER